MSNGDNAGVATGVASGTVMGPNRHVTAAFTVLVGGQPATRLTSVGIQNNTNCPGMRAVPSQVMVPCSPRGLPTLEAPSPRLYEISAGSFPRARWWSRSTATRR